jgi:hypothetical protein
VKLDRWSDQYPPTLQVCNLLRRSDCSSKATRHGRARPSCARASRQALPVLDRQQAGAECRMMARRKRRAAGAGARQSAAMMVSRARQLQLPSFAVSRSCSIDPTDHRSTCPRDRPRQGRPPPPASGHTRVAKWRSFGFAESRCRPCPCAPRVRETADAAALVSAATATPPPTSSILMPYCHVI